MAEQKDTSPVEEVPAEQEVRAVAIKYDVKNDKAPRVTAKGRSLVADRILAEARKNGIPVYQNKSLVNMLMALEIDRVKEPPMFEVSPTHFAATWLLDPRAPKVPVPEEIVRRRNLFFTEGGQAHD